MKLTVRTLALLCALLMPVAYAAPDTEAESTGKSGRTAASADAPHVSAPGEGAVGDLILQAVSLMGIAYRFGGNTPVNGFDCSGFIRYIFQSAGVNLPRSAAEQAQVGHPVSREELKPGDVLFFNTRGFNYSHNGLYLGNGRFIHAPRTGKNIEIASLGASYWSGRFNGARRMAKGAGGVVPRGISDEVKLAESLPRKRDDAGSTLADASAAALLGGGVAALTSGNRVHATLGRDREPAVKVPALSAACKSSRNARTAKCKAEKLAIAKAEKQAAKAGKNAKGSKYTLKAGKAESGKTLKGKSRDKASSKGNSKYRAVSSSKGKAAVKPSHKKKR